MVPPDEGVLWIDVQGLSDHDLIRGLGERFHLHPLALADVVNLGQRPKVEAYGDVLFCVVRMVTLTEAHHVKCEQVTLFIGPRFVISFQEDPGDCLDPLRQRIRQARPLMRQSGSDYLGSMIIDAIIDGYFPVVESFGERLEELEARVIDRPKRPVLREIYEAKRELLELRRSTWPLRETLVHLVRDPPPSFHANTVPFLRDAADHAMQVADVIETYRELASSFLDVYLSGISHRTNEVMKVLTVLSSIFIPLTFLAGVYGMNFDTRHPYNMPELGWAYGYPAFLGVCAATAVVLLVIFRRFGWLGGRSDE